MAILTEKRGTVSVGRDEYFRLKKLEHRFGDFFAYFEHLFDIREARKEVKKRKLVSQGKLFKRLGL